MINDSAPIMLLEDDEIDAITVRRAIKEIDIKNDLVHHSNGEEALEYLQNETNKLPCLILLDINMPRMNGIEFLEEIKDIDRLKRIPVIVLTTSKEDQDRYNTFNLGISGYMVKPVSYEKFLDVMASIKAYWMNSEFPD